MTIGYHEPTAELSTDTRQLHRAIATLIEEWEAIDWYQQRIDVTEDEDLRGLLVHNRDEEIEHAAMALEWIRRQVPAVDEQLRTYLFTTGPIAEIEEGAESKDAGDDGKTSSGHRGLGIGKVAT